MITITHNGTDITAQVSPSGFGIEDQRNSTRDTFNFTIEKQPGGFTPLLNAEIIVTRDGERIFGGSILSLETSVEAPPTVTYAVECVDFTYQLDRKLITERFIDQSIEDIIAFLGANYAPTFTVTGVRAPQEVARISFNRLTFSECLDKLAKLNNFYWYVDYFKDIHFFAKNDEVAPFNLTDTSGNYIPETLRIRSDLSQLRNIIQVIGSEQATSPRTTKHAGDGSKTEFPTNFKFAEEPTVTVNGVAKTVGLENIDVSGFDCYWSFQQKYIRFDPTAIPPVPTSPATTNINITGNPLVPLIAIVPDNDSIAQFGEFEHAIVETSLLTQDQTIDRGIAQLEAFASALNEAQFDTYTPGLRSGQIININSALHGVDADYVVQGVSFTPYPNGSELDGIWSVTLASTATMNLVDTLRSLLKKEELEDDEMQVLFAVYRFIDEGMGTDVLEDAEFTVGPYLWGTAIAGFSKYG